MACNGCTDAGVHNEIQAPSAWAGELCTTRTELPARCGTTPRTGIGSYPKATREPVCCNGVVTPGDPADIAAIKQLKYRYLRALDTKHWDDFTDTLAEDVTGDYGSSVGTELHFTNRADLVDYLRQALGPGVITEHRVTHPEITVTGDTATGIWYLQDRVIVAEFNFMLIGAAFYHDQYRRTTDGWRISATGYDRTYEATMSLAGLNFNIRPGRALAD